MHKGSGLISLKIGKTEVQKARSAGSQKCKKLEVQSNFAHCANFSACAKLLASDFQPRTTPFCIFSNFTPDVITIDIGILLFHFFVRLYIAILCTVEGTDSCHSRVIRNQQYLYPKFLLLSYQSYCSIVV